MNEVDLLLILARNESNANSITAGDEIQRLFPDLHRCDSGRTNLR